MAVIPEVLSRESILFKKLYVHGFPLPKAPTSGFAGMMTFYEAVNILRNGQRTGKDQDTLLKLRPTFRGSKYGFKRSDSFGNRRGAGHR
jgi:hypothetical protein